jgi:hypothetical protein
MEMLQIVLKTSVICFSKAEYTELVLTQLELLTLQHSTLHSEYFALYRLTSRGKKYTKDLLTEMLANLLI